VLNFVLIDKMSTDASATLWYLEDLPLYNDTKPYIANLPPTIVPPGKRTNQVSVAVPNVPVKDMRNAEKGFDIDVHGFQFTDEIKSSMSYEDWEDPARIANVYIKEVETYLKRSFGAEKAIVMAPNVCSSC